MALEHVSDERLIWWGLLVLLVFNAIGTISYLLAINQSIVTWMLALMVVVLTIFSLRASAPPRMWAITLAFSAATGIIVRQL
jgi:hypothetical protein